MPLLTVLILALATSCAGLTVRPGLERALSRSREPGTQVWGALSIAATALAGSGALSTSLPDDRDTRLGIGIASATVIAFGAAALFVRDDVLAIYADECQTRSSTIAE